jgi:hypothetical protein
MRLPCFAITGGTQVTIADRLPPAERKAAWELGYTAYQHLWRMQEQMIDKLPLHHKGEVLSGLAQTADRTGRGQEAAAGVERIVTLLPDTPYATRARQWKTIPVGGRRASWRARPVTRPECWSHGSPKSRNNRRVRSRSGIRYYA